MLNQSTTVNMFRTGVYWYIVKYLLAGLMLGAVLSASAQQADSTAYGMPQVPAKLFRSLQQKLSSINDDVLAGNLRGMHRLEAREQKIRKKLAKKDAALAAALFTSAPAKYAALEQALSPGGQAGSGLHTDYIAGLDTLQTALAFLAGNGLHAAQIKQAVSSIHDLQNNFRQAQRVQEFVEQRKIFLQQQLGKAGFAKHLKSYQKQAYYYQAQVQQYKALLNDPSKLQAHTMAILKKMPLFRQFFQTHSWLAAMFPLHGSREAATAGALQSREAVAQSLAQRFGASVQVQQLVQQQVQGAQLQPTGLKDKIKSSFLLPGKEGAAVVAGFTPNSQKTKSFKKRLEFGSSIQTVKANRFFPSTTDIGLSIGYKLNDKSLIGIGSAYKMGWGSDIRRISITHQGLGLRSFVDYKVKGLWFSGGAEMNYRSRFSSFEVLNSYSAWQKSALLGLSRKYQVSRKVKGNMQLLYDFLWKQQVPRTQPVLFRFGYSFR